MKDHLKRERARLGHYCQCCVCRYMAKVMGRRAARRALRQQIALRHVDA